MTIHPYFKRHENPSSSWAIPDLLKAYDWPTGAAPGGGTIYIVELGGGWKQADVAAAFKAMGLPAPDIEDLSADGTTTNTPGSDADGEVALDIQISAAAYALATGEAATVKMVWGSDIAACLTFAKLHAGSPLLPFAAAGDNDSSDGGPDPANVDCPASCPSVIACGGTSKPRNGPEVVWNNSPGNADGSGTGGGFSTIFASQPWQFGIPSGPAGLGRMVPDVAANADPDTVYEIVLDGRTEVFGGTSAVAPLYAGLFAALGYDTFSCSWGADEADWEAGSCMAMESAAQAAVGSLDVLSALYSPAGRKCFTDITQGNNGMYEALVGPDACTGVGSPLGNALMELHTDAADASA